MLGYDNEIIYKKGKENVLVDALSHQYKDAKLFSGLSLQVPNWLDEFRSEWLTHLYLISLRGFRRTLTPIMLTLGRDIH